MVPAVARPTSFYLIDRLLAGRLEVELKERRGNGDSYVTISRWFLREHDLEVAAETVRIWCQRLGIEKAVAS